MTTPRFSRRTIAAGAAALGALGAIGVAQLTGGANPIVHFTQAASTDATTPTTAASGSSSASANDRRPARRAPLDADTDAKVKAAALEAVPGATYDHGHKTPDGYVAELTKADGTTRVLVREDANFKVTAIKDPAPERGGRRRGHGHRQPLDADTDAKVKAAALEAVPGATYDHGHKTPDGYVAGLTKADGTTRVLVREDANFKVTAIKDPAPERGPGGPGRHHDGPDDDAPPAANNAA